MAIYYMMEPWYKKKNEIYGVKWDGSSSKAWARTDAAAGFSDPIPATNNGTGSSPFDDIMPWAGMEKVEDANAGTLVAIPKFYFKLDYANPTATVKGLKIQISPNEFPGSQVSPAHMDRGDGKGERDVVYVGRYHCATSTYKSTTGSKPIASKTRAAFRTSIHQKGSDIWQWDYAMLMTIQMLYLVEFADWNSQGKIGYGCGNGSSLEYMGNTDAMRYHTGTNKNNAYTYGQTQYRYIEDLWGNVLDWCDGIYINSYNIYAIKNPSDFSDSSGGTNVGEIYRGSGYISAYNISSANGFTWLMYPPACSGSDSTYTCDYGNFPSSGIMTVGAPYINKEKQYGLFYFSTFKTSSSSETYIGSRLMKLP